MTTPVASADVMRYAQKKTFKLIPIPRRSAPVFQPPARTAASPESFGRLGKLPMELMHLVLEELDMQTLCRLTKVSRGARQVVTSYPPFAKLIEHGGAALIALRNAELLAVHPAVALYQVMRSQECYSCGHFGAFLTIITAKRSCHACQTSNTRNRALFLVEAQQFLGLTAEEASQLKRAHYAVPLVPQGPVHMNTAPTFVNAAEALQLARAKTRGGPVPQLDNKWGVWRHPVASLLSLDKQTVDPLLNPALWTAPHEGWKMMTHVVVLFPALASRGDIETGVWCRGCQHLRANLKPGVNDAEYVAYVSSEIWQFYLLGGSYLEILEEYLQRTENRAYSTAGFRDHVQHCAGVRQLQDAARARSQRQR